MRRLQTVQPAVHACRILKPRPRTAQQRPLRLRHRWERISLWKASTRSVLCPQTLTECHKEVNTHSECLLSNKTLSVLTLDISSLCFLCFFILAKTTEQKSTLSLWANISKRSNAAFVRITGTIRGGHALFQTSFLQMTKVIKAAVTVFYQISVSNLVCSFSQINFGPRQRLIITGSLCCWRHDVKKKKKN